MISKALKKINYAALSSDTVIGEFSGRDSVAAIMKAFESKNVNAILPIATFAGTEYGNYDILYDNYLQLKEQVRKQYGETKVLYELLEYSDQRLWHLLNGRYATELIERYGFYIPCIGCHLYFHLTKLKYADRLSKKIISGERSSHDGRIKVNQLPEVLESYRKVISKLGYELIMPIEHMAEGNEVETLIGWNWDEGESHPKCVLSGNYRDISGKAVFNELQVKDFLESYIEKIGLVAGEYVLGRKNIEEVEKTIKELL